MDSEKKAVPGAGVSLSVHPHILAVCRVINGVCGTWTHFGWTSVAALLLSTTSGPFKVFLAALEQCLVGKILIAT